jgi:tRNA-modifying protein YgfZ
LVAEVATVELDAQYRQLREECGLLDRSDRGKLALTGSGAAEYLQGQLTNDVKALEPGTGHYAALLDRKGHLQADMRVLALGEAEFWIDTEPEGAPAARHHLQMFKVGHEVEVTDLGAERAILSLIGPASAALAGTPPLGEYACERRPLAGVGCLVAGTREGIDLIAPAAMAGQLREALLGAGAVEVCPEAVEILRIEAGVPRFGAEMGTQTMPAEAGILERAVSFTKGCYIGQETVARLHYRGRPNRHLLGLRLSQPAPPGAALRLAEKEVGHLASACVSPAFGPIGLAIVRREAEPGAEVAVGEDGVTARLVDLPFG